ncbi:uncharacterized protein MELLADRAFT_124501 [Melampsora larici-populina 98AG31]|uniref:Secreted protein n=1 Tax=Melampsora larici-populina (strain 98AG31 / pathotype 3-4-7) TaxID=747676 RepID=F4RDM6_MELLP|nr:uncharacterized protein MELLADRAFT_124501 [Melampsora larici-populina 98AG31]EGG09581.1 secreted protein [Melampsora larici-populina 98AG31]
MKLSFITTILLESISFSQAFGSVTEGLKSEKEMISADGAVVKPIDALAKLRQNLMMFQDVYNAIYMDGESAWTTAVKHHLDVQPGHGWCESACKSLTEPNTWLNDMDANKMVATKL